MFSPPLSCFLSAAFSRQAEIREYARLLQREGIQVIARWLYQDGGDHQLTDAVRIARGNGDIEDLLQADVYIRFTDDLGSLSVMVGGVPYVPGHLLSGARLVEMGIAMHAGRQIVIVGGHQPIFDYQPYITHVKDLCELIEHLRNCGAGLAEAGCSVPDGLLGSLPDSTGYSV